jgi:heme-degrading monooxygenase HmoA
MISRHWKGTAHSDRAADYVRHLKEETFPALRRIPGFRRASILRRQGERGVDFLIVTEWESLDALRRFAGEDESVAVVPPAVREMMVAFDPRVEHYEVVEAAWVESRMRACR